MKSVTQTCKLFILDPLWDGLATLEQIHDLEAAGYELVVDRQPKPLSEVPGLFDGDEPRALAINPDYVGWSVKAQEYAQIPGLQAIFIQSTSFGWIETAAEMQAKVPICNIRNFSTDSVADWAVLMMLSLARRIPELIKDGFPEDYERYVGTELKGKTAGVIGLGNIGAAIAERCAGMGMNVRYWSRSSTDDRFEKTDLAEVLQSDVIFPAMAENAETRRLLTPKLLKAMPTTSLFVSVVHKYYDHELVLDMVGQRKLAGYGFEDSAAAFSKYPGNVWAAPAYAWCTKASMQKAMAAWVDGMLAFRRGEPKNIVN